MEIQRKRFLPPMEPAGEPLGTGWLGLEGHLAQFVSTDSSFEPAGPANGATVIN
jgi:hypothetical protein